jgi:hypothetical protein
MKDVQMAIRVEPALRASFTQAAELNHRPAAQVLREFMRYYVEQTQKREVMPAVALSTAERQQREKAVAFARASVGLEGFKPSASDEDRARRFIDGSIGLADFLRVDH